MPGAKARDGGKWKPDDKKHPSAGAKAKNELGRGTPKGEKVPCIDKCVPGVRESHHGFYCSDHVADNHVDV